LGTVELVYTIRVEREVDGRYLAYIDELPGVMKYGKTQDAAARAVVGLALAVISDQIEHGEKDFLRGASDAVVPANFRFVPVEFLASQ
jgi:predicted RNase H-like HicB family nuclease